MPTPKKPVTRKVFLIANCYENYSVVANRIFKMWVAKSLKTAGVELDGSVLTYYDDTPIQAYGKVGSVPFSAGASALWGPKLGTFNVQYMNFIWLIALTSVCIARIQEADMIVVVTNGVTLIPSHCVMATIAQVLKKEVVFWNDDLRVSWGCTNDLLTMGMSVTPYKYIWSSTEPNPAINKGQQTDTEFNVQRRTNLPGTMRTPHQGNVITCTSEGKKTSEWGELSAAILQTIEATDDDGDAGKLSDRLEKLGKLGQIIIASVEKPIATHLKKGEARPGTWKPGIQGAPESKQPPGATDPVTIFYNMAVPISSNARELLSTKEQQFMKASLRVAAASVAPPHGGGSGSKSMHPGRGLSDQKMPAQQSYYPPPSQRLGGKTAPWAAGAAAVEENATEHAVADAVPHAFPSNLNSASGSDEAFKTVLSHR